MDTKKMYRFIAIFSALLCITIIPFLTLFFTGVVTPFIYGFCVDDVDHIYIGTKNEIRVYANGEHMDTINLAPINAYTFTMNDSGNILLATPSNVYIMDTEGNILDKQQDRVGDTYHQIQDKKSFTSSNGDEYKLVAMFGWSRIVKNESETVYKISALSFGFKVFIPLSILVLFSLPALAAIQISRQDSNKKSKPGDGLREP